MDLTGRTFGRLTVLRRGRHNSKHLWYLCRCACLIEKEVRSDHLREGTIRSCDCLHREKMRARGHHHQPGEQFGRLTIIRDAGIKSKKRGRSYLCRCRCKKELVVNVRHLRSGESKSCGCRFRDLNGTFNLKHGKAPAGRGNKVPVYSAYCRQKSWCRNPAERCWQYYGGRGIVFLFEDFPSFYAEVGDKPGPDYWLMRKDRDGNIAPGNVHWVQKKKKHHKFNSEVTRCQ